MDDLNENQLHVSADEISSLNIEQINLINYLFTYLFIYLHVSFYLPETHSPLCLSACHLDKG